MWERGLKLTQCTNSSNVAKVAPYVGAWIKMQNVTTVAQEPADAIGNVKRHMSHENRDEFDFITTRMPVLLRRVCR